MEKIEKIDAVMLKYATASRKLMLDLVNRGVRPAYFSGPAASIFQVMFDLFMDPAVGQVISPEAFVTHCRSKGLNQIADTAKEIFPRLAALTIPESDYTYNLKVFRDRHNMRVTQDHMQIIQKAMADGMPVEAVNDLYRKAHNEIAVLNRIEVFDEGSLTSDVANMRDEYEKVSKNPLGFQGVTVGLPSLDVLTNGYQPSELIVVCGMEGTGKSLLMMNMGVNAWLGRNKIGQEITHKGRNVLYFTLEMPRSNRGRAGTGGYLNRRIVSCLGELDFNRMRKADLDADDQDKFSRTLDFISDYEKQNQFYVVDIPRGAKVEDIEVKFQEVSEKFPVDLVIVDYIGIMSGSDKGKGEDADWQSQGQIAGHLHEFARMYSVPVMTGAQVNRPQGTNNSLSKQNYNTTRVARSAQITQNANIVMQIGCRDNEKAFTDMPLYITKMRDGNQADLSLTKAFHKMRVYDAQSGPTDLSIFEDQKEAEPKANAKFEMGNFELSNSAVLDYGDQDATVSDDEMDF